MRQTFLFILVAASIGCGVPNGDPGPPPPGEAPTVMITPATVAVSVSGTHSFSVTTQATSGVTGYSWMAADSGIARVAGNGPRAYVIGVRAGTTTVTVRLLPDRGLGASASVTVR